VQVLDEQQDFGSGVSPADADVVELAAVAQGDGAGGADLVSADPVVGVGGPVAGDGLGPGGGGGGRGDPAGQGFVWPLLVVVAGEYIQQGLQLSEGGGLGRLGGEPVLQRLGRVGRAARCQFGLVLFRPASLRTGLARFRASGSPVITA
jgi:hypothetical protein